MIAAREVIAVAIGEEADAVAGGNGGTSQARAHRTRRVQAYPRGRIATEADLAETRRLLGDLVSPDHLAQDHLIEALHIVHEAKGYLSLGRLAALAQLARLSMAEVFEVATFYAHFDIRADGDDRPPIVVRVCDGLPCEMAGARRIYQALYKALGERVVMAPCMGQCAAAPAAEVHTPAGAQHLTALDKAEDITGHITAAMKRHEEIAPASKSLEDYCKQGGYRCLKRLATGDLSPAEVIETLNKAQLRGLGGAGFPTGRKWAMVAGQPVTPRYVAVNADEGEPGTFKDRHFLETNPHQVLEGALIAAKVVGADAVYFYLRDEYAAVRRLLTREIARLGPHAQGIKIHLRRGAGAYICGEESAMLESLEGKRGLPRHKPPYPGEVGLFSRPTVINNVETLYWVREILVRGADFYGKAGRNGGIGWRAYSVSGRVREPGVKIAEAGITVQELIQEHCGGMAEGHVFKAYLPGGASGGILPATMADLPLTFGTLEPHGCFVGSAAVVVLSEHDDIADAVRNLMRFFKYESCGQCTPCRIGTAKACDLLDQPAWDRALLEDLAQVMRDASICGLGQAAPNPMQCALKYFAQEIPQDI
ncbi:MAG: NADH-ubiquinone oxidoreductase-F iron-sulfur binding region domain-containing protein [Pseudomonadota bacterium]